MYDQVATIECVTGEDMGSNETWNTACIGPCYPGDCNPCTPGDCTPDCYPNNCTPVPCWP